MCAICVTQYHNDARMSEIGVGVMQCLNDVHMNMMLRHDDAYNDVRIYANICGEQTHKPKTKKSVRGRGSGHGHTI